MNVFVRPYNLFLTKFFSRLRSKECNAYISYMVVEVTRLLFGVLIAVFHRPIAMRMMRQERALDSYFRQRGIALPTPPSDSTAETLYFLLGIFICLAEAVRIWVGI
jgi:hypothetical protein